MRPPTLRVLPPRAVYTFKLSRLSRGTSLSPHCGGSNKRWRIHMGLVSDGSARIRVGQQTRAWEEGVAFVFDDSFEHEVYWAEGQGANGRGHGSKASAAAPRAVAGASDGDPLAAPGLEAHDRLVLLVDIPHPALVAAAGSRICPAGSRTAAPTTPPTRRGTSPTTPPTRPPLEPSASPSGMRPPSSPEAVDLRAKLDAFVRNRRGREESR